MNRRMLFAAALGLVAGLSSAAFAADVKPYPVVIELDNPSGVGAHGLTGHVFIVARTGVYRLDPKSNPLKAVFEVNGFPTDIYGKGPKYNIGPLGVGFLGDSQLIIADGSQPDGKEIVRIYRISASAPATPAKADSQEITLGPIAPGSKESPKGEGNFYGVAVTKNAIFITSNGDDTKGWILKADLKDGKPGKLTPFIATKPLVNVDAPVGITVSPEGQLVVGQMGEMTVPNDSLLSFYDPATGKLLKNYKTGLSDIAGVAYSPKSGKLYCVDFSWSAPEKGGLFRLDISGDTVKAEKIVKLDKPTALAFDKTGNLYITQFGTQAKGSTKFAGSVVRIDAGL